MNRQFNYKTIRIMIGAAALVVAPVSMLIGGRGILSSISSYYWSDAHDIFVGLLTSAGFLLYTYNGSGDGRDCEYYLSKFAGVFAIFVALFPTSADSNGEPAAWVDMLARRVGLTPNTIHFWAAALLFVCLIVIMIKISNRARRIGKTTRALIYKVIAALMVAGIGAIYVIGELTSWNYTILALEIWGLSFFGGGWLYAGWYQTEPVLEQRKKNF